MKRRIVYTVPNTPQGGPATHEIVVTEERIDRDWTYFRTDNNAAFGCPTRWIDKTEDIP